MTDSHENDHRVDAVPGASSAPNAASGPGTAPAPTGVTKAMLLWVGAGVVVLAFVASFLGSTVANRPVESAPVATVEVTVEPSAAPEPTEEALPPLTQEEIEALIPAGSIVRAGNGAPSTDTGLNGDLYIDLDSANVYLRTDDVWASVGNLKYAAVANLTGAQGAQGETGAQGAPGTPGKPGEPGVAGTQIVLGKAAPTDAEPCGNDGDLFVDTVNAKVYVCSADAWVAQGAK